MLNQIISVVMSVWNGEKYLRQSIDSILSQTFKPIELIVVDDGSTDRTNEIIQEYADRIKVITQANKGQASGFIAGLEIATGDYFAFQDADDIWSVHKLSKQNSALRNAPELEAVFCMSEQFYSPEFLNGENLVPRSPIMIGELASCMLIRRAAFERIGPFEPSSKTTFVEWLGRAKQSKLKYEVLVEVLHHRRLHASNFGRMFQKERDQDLLAALRLQIVRSRKTRDGKDSA